MTKAKYGKIGKAGLNYTDRYVSEDRLPELKYPQASKIYKQMSEEDAIIGACISLIKTYAAGTEWDVIPFSDSSKDKKKAEFLKECMHDMENSWDDFIMEALSMIVYGFSYHEIVYKIRRGSNANGKYNSQYKDGRIGWRKLPSRSQSTMNGWKFSEDGEIEGMYQFAPPRYTDVLIPIEKSLLFRTDSSNDNPEGQSMLRKSYRAYMYKKRIEEIEAIAIERDCTGLPLLKYPANLNLFDDTDPEMVTQRRIAEDLLTQVRRDSGVGVMIPDDWDFQLVVSGGNLQIPPNDVIVRYSMQIAQSMLSDIITLGYNKEGSFALAEVKKSMIVDFVETILQKICDELNKRAVPNLIDYNNFGKSDGYPKISFRTIKEKQPKDIAVILKSVGLDATNAPQILDPIFEMLGLPTDEMEDIKKQLKADKDRSEKLEDEKAKPKESNGKKDGERSDVEFEGLNGVGTSSDAGSGSYGDMYNNIDYSSRE